jgi:hypothetical protein
MTEGALVAPSISVALIVPVNMAMDACPVQQQSPDECPCATCKHVRIDVQLSRDLIDEMRNLVHFPIPSYLPWIAPRALIL